MIDYKNKTIIVVPGEKEPPVYVKELRTKIGTKNTKQYWVIKDQCWENVLKRLEAAE